MSKYSFSVNQHKFHYRSYIYDNELGLYYLRSRYYDPVTGRFLNADIYCDTQSNILGTNMFTYCNNNFINQIDPKGTDAIWLQDVDAVYGAGHTSLLIQDAIGNWWFTYWGDKSIIAHPFGHGTIKELNCYINGFDPRNHNNFYLKHYYDGYFDLLLYIKGDFTNSLTYYLYHIFLQQGTLVKSKSGDNPIYTYKTNRSLLYNLLIHNCMQSCIDALMFGHFYLFDISIKDYIWKIRRETVPNIAFSSLAVYYPPTIIYFSEMSF